MNHDMQPLNFLLTFPFQSRADNGPPPLSADDDSPIRQQLQRPIGSHGVHAQHPGSFRGGMVTGTRLQLPIANVRLNFFGQDENALRLTHKTISSCVIIFSQLEKFKFTPFSVMKPHLFLPFLATFALLAPTLNAEERSPLLEKQDLFTAGELGYKLYHIPGILVTKEGTVLAWCEARETGSDWDKIDILLRRSEDEGKTWAAAENITVVPPDAEKNPEALRLKNANKEGITVNNPVFIADRDGTIHFLYCVEYGRAFYRRSTDDAKTWSDPVEISSVFQDFPYDAKVFATGPNHSIQLKSGRLIVPVWLSTGEGGNAHRPSVTSTIYSDDGGDTWRAGEIAVPNSEDKTLNPNETTAVELADGTVLLNVRNESAQHRRIVVTSPDGATDWSEPRFDDALLEPICMASIIRYSKEGEGSRNRVLFSNPHNLFDSKGQSVDGKPSDKGRALRKNLAIKISYDECQTWAFQKVLEPESGMYSDLAVTQSGVALCLYGRRLGESGASFAGDRITVARFNLTWLTDGADIGD